MYHIFVDSEFFDKIQHFATRWALRRQLVQEKVDEMVIDLYSGSKARVNAGSCSSSSFEFTVGVRQGSASSLLLFNLVIEEATNRYRRGVP